MEVRIIFSLQNLAGPSPEHSASLCICLVGIRIEHAQPELLIRPLSPPLQKCLFSFPLLLSHRKVFHPKWNKAWSNPVMSFSFPYTYVWSCWFYG